MTIEEAIKHLITIKEYYTSDRDFTTWGEDYEPLSSEEKQAVDKAVETLEKQIPKNPDRGVCPNCGSRHIYAATLMKAECFKCCGDCGQALDWSDNDD